MYRADLWNAARDLPARMLRQGRALSFVGGFFLTLIQGQAALQAQELPQVQTGVNARFDGALAPVVTGNNMVINQVADRATLHWQSFNIGQGHGVEFKQPDGSSVALNRIFDGVPSQIAGQLKANGQVYLINQNGIVFGNGAQVNVQSLVASTLNIDDQVFNEIGIVNAINTGENFQAALPAFDSQGNPMGEIRIAPGATLESATTGRILVFAPTIVNEGTISTPEGQQVLAASQDRVYLAASADPNLRGLLVEVSTGGDVTNLGTLIAEKGNITLLGLAVNQQGIARATTSVSLNGSIRLAAQDMSGAVRFSTDVPPNRRPRGDRGGELVLGSGSVTEVVPDTALDEDGDPILALDAQTQSRSVVDLAGTRVQFEDGSRVTSTGGEINIIAARDPGATTLLLQPGDPDLQPSQVIIASGAVLDVSGDDTTVVSVARNVVAVEARGNELADAPLQREGPIRNQTLKVDVRTGTDFLNIAGPAASIQRSAAERQSAGGLVSVQSEGRVVLEEGARIDVSGGQVTYTAGTVRTSRLQQSDGTVVDIARADPNRTYLGVASDAVRQEAGYVEGTDAGALEIRATGITLAGTLEAGATAGINQRRPTADLVTEGTPAFARPFDQLPLGGALDLNLLRSGLPDLIIGVSPGGSAPSVAPLVLATDWLQDSGVSRLSVSNAGALVVNQNLVLPAFSTLNLTGSTVDILADVRSPGGQISLSTFAVGLIPEEDQLVRIDGRIDLSGTWVNDNPLLNPGPPTAPIVVDGGRLNVNSGASIEVSNASVLDVSAGAWLAATGTFTGGQGGRISFTTGETDNSAFGARLDLGAELRGFGFSGGGELVLNVERLRIVPGAAQPAADGFVLDGGRKFSVETIVGAGAPQFVLQVGAGIFEQGGFSSYELSTSRPDLAIAPASEIRLRTATLALTDSQAGLRATGTAIDSLAAPTLLPAISRQPARLVLTANNDLLDALGAVADLSLGAGSRIIADAGSDISLSSATSLFINGSIETPGGRINLGLGNGSGGFQPTQMIWFGAGSSLSANGAVLLDPVTLAGRRQGQVLDAGRITVRADQGSIVAAPGSRLSADGVATTLDIGAGIPVPTPVAGAAGTIELTAAESLLFQGTLSAAAPAGSATPGGRLIIGLDPDRRGVVALTAADGIPRGPHTLVMQDYSGLLPGAGQAVNPDLYSTGFVPVSQLATGGFDALEVVVRSSATSSNSVGVPVPDTLVSLPVIRFPVDLSLSLDRSIVLDAAIFETDGAQVDLSAPYVALGFSDSRVRLDGAIPLRDNASNPQVTNQPIRLSPTAGAGTLTVSGELIELVGESATRGFGDAAVGTTGVTLTASDDVRVRGVRKALSNDYAGLFRTAGNLLIDAPRLYPTTLTDFEIAVEGVGGELTLAGGGAGSAPLSVGGALTLTADVINQGGSLYAPLGTLNLNATSRLSFSEGSLTSTSAAGVTAPFFRTEPGGALILPAPAAGGVQVVFVETVGNPQFERELPRQGINLAAPDVALLPGSRFDLRGGGDVRATEFVPGPGGSRDILLASLDGGANPSFAILPGNGSFAPFDPLETPAAAGEQGLRIGDTLILEDGLPGLPAGEYAILPARYALFGGYLVTPVEGSTDLPAGQSLTGLDGRPILAGRLGVAGNDTASSRTLGFAIESSEQVRQRAEYLETPLDTLYTSDTLRAPRDGGSLVVQAGDSLILQGELLRATTSQGLGVAVDIATSAALSVVNQFSGAGGIELLTADLENLGADSLLLGGRRTRLADAVRIDVASSGINVAAGVDLDLPELLLVADNIFIDGADSAATRLASTAPVSNRATRILLEDDAAILAVSNRVLTLDRGAATGSGSSSLTLGSEATLGANGSLLLDASGNVSLAGTLADTDGAISLGAGLVSLGDTDGQGIASGLVLSNAALAAFSGSDLRLRSAGSLDLYGALGGNPADPLTFGRLTLDARGLVGVANDGEVAVLRADTIELRNGSGGSLTGTPVAGAAGSGLELRADRLELGDGRVDIAGFETTLLVAGDTLLVTGDTDLRVSGNLAIDTPVITAAQATTGNIAVTGSLNVLAGDAAAPLPAAAGLAAQLTLSAADVDFAGRIRLPSGTLRLIQTGEPANPVAGAGLRLADTAEIDVSGATLTFGPKQLGTPGGAIELDAGTGDLSLASARLDVSSASVGGGAGSLSLRAPVGEISFGPGAVLLGQDPAAATGRFELDAARLVGPEPAVASPVSALANLLATGGFAGRQAIRLRDQDIVVDGDTSMVARDIRLSSDTGAVSIAGTLDASGANAGNIWLAAGDALTLSGTLRAVSTANDAAGGRVDLHALDADGDDSAGLADVINLTAGSLIDVSGGADGAGGTVLLHTRRLDTNSDNQTDTLLLGALDGEISGAGRAQLVATRILRDPGATLVADPGTGALVPRVTITSGQIGAWRTETENFLNGQASLAGPLTLTAGLQVESTGDLILADAWNFYDGWYFGRDLSDATNPLPGLTGVTTLRAARNIELRADLTDSFAPQLIFGAFLVDQVTGALNRLDGSGNVVERIAPQSWNYRLAAGADLASADVLATGTGPGELRLDPGVRVRTGTGDIDLAASGDIRLRNGAAVYTAGWNQGTSAQLNELLGPTLAEGGITTDEFFAVLLNGGQFPDGGGNVGITAGGRVFADSAPGAITAWQPRIGSGVIGERFYTADGLGAVPTHWGVAYEQFQNGIGVFGGGNLRVDAGGDVANLVLAAPTTGRSRDGVEADTSGGLVSFLPSQRTTEVFGGGRIDLNAGGQLVGGQLVLGQGSAALRTGAGSSGGGANPSLYVGADAELDWTANGNLTVAGLDDPTVVALDASQLTLLSQVFVAVTSTASIDNRFYTYTPTTRVNLTSLGGDVSLDGSGFGQFLPPSLAAVSFGGDVNVVASPVVFFPSPVGQLELLARGNVTGNFLGSTEARLTQSDQDRSLLPSVERPDITLFPALPAAVPVHTGDTVRNLIVARDGAVQSRPGNTGFWTLELAKPTLIQAGTDISDVAVRVQNIAATDLTSFQAGRDIRFGVLRNDSGQFSPADRRRFEIWGPGAAEFLAGRDISLGTSAGIETIGNTRNAALSPDGASLLLLAGTGGDPAWDRFIEVYLSDEPSAYRDQLNDFLARVEQGREGFDSSSEVPVDLAIQPGEYTAKLLKFLEAAGIPVVNDDPVGTLQSLDRGVQRTLLADIAFSELKEWGSASETPSRADRLNYTRAFTALDTLFALDAPLGERAGDFGPGTVEETIRGFLTITDPQAANDAQVALFATFFPPGEQKGDINLLLSQVQTLAGGNLTMLAPGGDINAGAADSGIIAKQPADLGIVTARGGAINIAVDRDLLVNSTRVFALQGDLLVWSSNGNIDAGKGAKTVTSVPDPITRIDADGQTIIEFPPAVAGSGLQGVNAALFAPRGAVNAGDAGIRTSGDLTIGAVEVVGADNIDVGGVEIGFSSSDVAAVAPPGAAAASSAATKGVESQAGLLGDADESGARTLQGTQVSFITVEVLGFGPPCDPEEEDCD